MTKFEIGQYAMAYHTIAELDESAAEDYIRAELTKDELERFYEIYQKMYPEQATQKQAEWVRVR